jgi:hypothetical protein
VTNDKAWSKVMSAISFSWLEYLYQDLIW